MKRFACRSCIVLVFVAALAAAQQNGQQPPPPRQPVKIDPAYQKAADETGGQVYVFDREHPEQMGAIMAANMGSLRQLLTTNGELSGERVFEAVVAGTESRLIATATGVTSFELKHPTGMSAGANGVDVVYTKLANGGMFVITNPEGGTWSAVLNGTGHFSLVVSVAPPKGVSVDSPVVSSLQPLDDIEFDSFEFLEVAGRPGHEGLFKIPGFPVAGKPYPVEAKMSGDFSTVRFELRSADNQQLQTLILHRRHEPGSDDRVYEGEVTVAETPFRVYAIGVDVRGRPYQRASSHLIRPQSFAVSGPRYLEWNPGETATCNFTVENFGAAGGFTATILDVANYLTTPRRIAFDLATGDTKQLALSFTVPTGAVASSDTVVVTVMRGSDASATNHAIAEPIIMRPE